MYLIMLDYPGTVSVSALKTAYTLHSWPSILAILSFLVGLQDMVRFGATDIYTLPEGKLDLNDQEIRRKLKNINCRDAFYAFNSDIPLDSVKNVYKKNLASLYGFEGDLKEVQNQLAARQEKVQEDRKQLQLERKEIDEFVQVFCFFIFINQKLLVVGCLNLDML